ncbi:MAG: HU family DNA-binding protein [Bdellovibrionaceae bacterium]|nr:HU family DNA-binding protein [Pseudobdellovibrionaceae bacterium]
MNKAQFVEKIAKSTNLTKTQTELVLDSAIDLIQKSVSKGEEVKIVGFGTFDRSERKSRNGRNPKTGSQILIPASKVPRFRPGKDFKSLVNKLRSPKA